MKNSRFKVGDCIFYRNSFKDSNYVLKIVDIVESDKQHLYYNFEIVYGNSFFGSTYNSLYPFHTRQFQNNSSIYNEAKILPKDWNESDILAMVL